MIHLFCAIPILLFGSAAVDDAGFFTLAEPEPERPYYTGTVQPSQTVQISFPVTGRLSYVAPEKSEATGSVYNAAGDIVEPGTLLARHHTDKAAINVELARTKVAHRTAVLADRKCTLDRESRLAARDATSAKVLQNARTAYDVAQSELDQARQDLALAEEVLDACRVPAPYGGVVSRVHRSRNASVAYSASAMTFSVLSTVKVVVELPEHLLRQLDPSDRVTIYPGGREKPVSARSFDLVSGKLECLVENPKFFSVPPGGAKRPRFTALGSVRDGRIHPGASLWITAAAILPDGDGHYVRKFEAEKGETEQRLGQARKVPVKKLDRYIMHGNERFCAVSPTRALTDGDRVIVPTEDDDEFKDGVIALYAPPRYRFYPGQQLGVRFSRAFRETGFYVPSKAVSATPDRRAHFVRCRLDGKTVRLPVRARAFGDWTLIDAYELEPGMRIVMPEERPSL